ncbi:MAG: DUF445 domain-containing protein [Acetivibrionales bacterium]|jgi:uncharacterized membrane protein YheB (UPF0754 family)
MNIRIIISPLVGGLIGLVTNGLAIRMLFRPLKPVYIGKLKLPFTPGLIPKERPYLAKAIGDVISRDLLDEETLKNTLLSDTMKSHIFTKIDEVADTYGKTGDTVETVLEKLASKDVIRDKLDASKEILSLTIVQKAIEQDIGKGIVDYACEEIVSKAKPILRTLTKSALNSVKEPVARKINVLIEEKSSPVIERFIGDQAEEILKMPVSDIIERYHDKIPGIKQYVWKTYEDIIANKLAGVLETVNISEVVCSKINELDLQELERIIMVLMKKELNALIWLGGLLGMIMGLIGELVEFI